MSDRESVLAEVSAERGRQDELWGGPAHDDAHGANDWIAILARHVGLAAFDGGPHGVCRADGVPVAHHEPERFRRQMVRVAAVALAAVEAHDRRQEALRRRMTSATDAP